MIIFIQIIIFIFQSDFSASFFLDFFMIEQFNQIILYNMIVIIKAQVYVFKILVHLNKNLLRKNQSFFILCIQTVHCAHDDESKLASVCV